MVGWNQDGRGWPRGRREAPTRAGDLRGEARSAPDAREAGGWTLVDVGTAVAALTIRWELAAGFVGLKLWQQASGTPGSAFAFARDKWDGLVGAARSLAGGGASFGVGWGGRAGGARSSGNHAFDLWRRDELARIEAERDRLRVAEHEFAAYRDELLHAKDREDFDRFMRAREARPELHRGA